MTPTVPTTGGTIRQNVISVPVIQLRMKLPPRYLRKRVFERALSFFSFLDFQVEFTGNCTCAISENEDSMDFDAATSAR